MDKQDLVAQLARHLAGSSRAALSARDSAALEAREGATPDEKREDARAAHQLGTIGRQHQRRALQAIAEIDALATFRPPPLEPQAVISLGAIVEIEDEDNGEGRTFFLAPVGAGVTLNGPNGDGLISVVTPVSPVGRAVIGRHLGDIVDVTVDGVLREWQISYVA
jgi:transcription elongation GreA/GreB family factor